MPTGTVGATSNASGAAGGAHITSNNLFVAAHKTAHFGRELTTTYNSNVYVTAGASAYEQTVRNTGVPAVATMAGRALATGRTYIEDGGLIMAVNNGGMTGVNHASAGAGIGTNDFTAETWNINAGAGITVHHKMIYMGSTKASSVTTIALSGALNF
jgi:hypothetical protein